MSTELSKRQLDKILKVVGEAVRHENESYPGIPDTDTLLRDGEDCGWRLHKILPREEGFMVVILHADNSDTARIAVSAIGETVMDAVNNAVEKLESVTV